jgi:hypothetical protein
MTYHLARTAPAIQVIPDLDGRIRMGTMLRLPAGTEVQVCGEGFDSQTVKVSWEGGYYYIFLQDVEPAQFQAAAV